MKALEIPRKQMQIPSKVKEILEKQWEVFLESSMKFPEIWVEIPRKLEGTFPEITRKILERYVKFWRRCRKMQESNGKILAELYIL